MIHLALSRRTLVLAVVAFMAVATMATASLVLTLSRGADAGGGFTDTPPWIRTHAAWLENNGIARGYSDRTFKPDDPITRGQTAFWLGNYNDSIELVDSNINLGPATRWTTTVPCPTWKRAVSGGVENPDQPDIMMANSYPVENGWKITLESDNNVNFNPPTLTFWAVCIPDPVR